MSPDLYQKSLQSWQNSYAEQISRTTRVYFALKDVQAKIIGNAVKAIRKEDVKAFIECRRAFYAVHGIIKAELSDIQEHLTEKPLEFPEWPYCVDEEIPYRLVDDLPQYIDDTVDVPF